MTKKTHLVTGGTGFIGSALVKKLVALGQDVRVFDNGSRGSESKLGNVTSKVDLITGDIRNLSDVVKASKGCNTIWHLAAVNGTENFYKKPGTVLEVGVKGITNVIDATKECSVDDVIVMSSSEVYQTPPEIPTKENAPLLIPDPMNARYSYGSSKMISEMMALHMEFCKRVMVVRPHNVYGPDMGWEHVVPELISKIYNLTKNGEKVITVPIQGTGKETRAYCFISDMVDGLMTVYENGKNKEIYHVGNPIETSVEELVVTIAKSIEVKATIKPGKLSQGSTSRRCPNIDKLNGLGFSPKVRLEVGVKQTVDWYLNNLKNNFERKVA